MEDLEKIAARMAARAAEEDGVRLKKLERIVAEKMEAVDRMEETMQDLEKIAARKTAARAAEEDGERVKELERIVAEKMATVERMEETMRELETIASERTAPSTKEQEALANHPIQTINTPDNESIHDTSVSTFSNSLVGVDSANLQSRSSRSVTLDNHNDRLGTFSFAPVCPPSKRADKKYGRRIAEEPVEPTTKLVHRKILRGPPRKASLSSIASTVSTKTRNDRIREAIERTDPRLVHPDGINVPRVNRGGCVMSFSSTGGRAGLSQRMDRVEPELGVEEAEVVQEPDIGVDAKDRERILAEPVEPMTPSNHMERAHKPLRKASLSSMASSISIMTGNERAQEAIGRRTDPRLLQPDGTKNVPRVNRGGQATSFGGTGTRSTISQRIVRVEQALGIEEDEGVEEPVGGGDTKDRKRIVERPVEPMANSVWAFQNTLPKL